MWLLGKLPLLFHLINYYLVPTPPPSTLNTTVRFISDNNYIDVSVESIVSIILLTSILYITLN